MPRRRRRRFRRVFIDVGRKARFQHFGCEIGQPQLAADMALSQTDGFGQLLVRAELASVQTSPPTPRLADGAQDVRVFLPVLAGAAIGAAASWADRSSCGPSAGSAPGLCRWDRLFSSRQPHRGGLVAGHAVRSTGFRPASASFIARWQKPLGIRTKCRLNGLRDRNQNGTGPAEPENCGVCLMKREVWCTFVAAAFMERPQKMLRFGHAWT